MKYQGSCHCGKISFEVEGELKGAMACNCSICQRKGSLLWFVPRTTLDLLTPEEAASTYTFNKHLIKHRFCADCGIHPYGEGVDPKGNAMAAINIRCLEGIDLAAVPIQNLMDVQPNRSGRHLGMSHFNLRSNWSASRRLPHC